MVDMEKTLMHEGYIEQTTSQKVNSHKNCPVIIDYV